MFKTKGQSIGEFIILIMAMSSAFFIMQTYMKRSIQTVVRAQADQITLGEEDRIFYNEIDPEESYSDSSTTTTQHKEDTVTDAPGSFSHDSIVTTQGQGNGITWGGIIDVTEP